jgi:hypothetical protein
MVPSSPARDTISSAEIRIFEKFRHVSGFDNWICLHSLRLSRSDYAACGEIDFLLLGPDGVFVCEVKGGRVAFDGKSWKHTNRYGQVNTHDRGPMKQAAESMFSLQKDLKESDKSALARRLLFGWFVVFPDIDFNVTSPEWNGAEVLDQRNLSTLDDFGHSLRNMISYWRQAIEGHSRSKSLLSEEGIVELASHCRPLFDRSPSLKNMVSTAVDVSNSLTAEQYRLVSLIDKNHRLVCEGGAGTGKSFIALEIARRRRDAGMSVLFTAKNPNLLTFLMGQPDTDQISFIAYDTLSESDRKWDFVIVDEAQDLMTTDNRLRLDEIVVGGFDNGHWLVCVDAATQAGFYGEYDGSQYDMILNGSSHLSLSNNCRNTGNIVTQIGLVVDKPIEMSLLADGPPVSWTPPLADIVSEARALEAFLSEVLMQHGFEQQDVTILELNPEHSPIKYLRKTLQQNIERIDVENLKKWPFRRVGVSSVRDFKGLESNVICLVGARDIGTIEQARNLLYVAMSRARALLWIANTPEFNELVKEIAEQRS